MHDPVRWRFQQSGPEMNFIFPYGIQEKGFRVRIGGRGSASRILALVCGNSMQADMNLN
jgi:hypothetical protein